MIVPSQEPIPIGSHPGCNKKALEKYTDEELDYYLDKKYFEGIIVTGEKLREKYNNITNNVFNANEIDLSIFKNYKIDNYKINRT